MPMKNEGGRPALQVAGFPKAFGSGGSVLRTPFGAPTPPAADHRESWHLFPVPDPFV